MVSFTTILAAGSAIGCALALPATVSKRETSLLKREQGTNGGYFYQYWTDGSGSSTYTNGAEGEYSTTWTNVGDFTAGKGWATGSDRAISFTGSFDPGSNGYLSVYTWSSSVETYILENFGPYNPGAAATKMGTLTSDGSTYDIYRDYPGTNPSDANFVQYWSIRQDKRSSGTVTTKNHYDAWNNLGMTYDPSGSYQIVSTEGFGSTGSSSITVSEGTLDASNTTSNAAASSFVASEAPVATSTSAAFVAPASTSAYVAPVAASSSVPAFVAPTSVASTGSTMPTSGFSAPSAYSLPAGPTAASSVYVPTSAAAVSPVETGAPDDCDVQYVMV